MQAPNSRGHILVLCFLLGLCFSCSVKTSNGRNRPYADLCMSQCDLVFLLLSQREIQNDLGLSVDQLAAVETIRKQDLKAIPNVTNTLASARNPKGQEEHANIILEAGEQIDQYRLSGLSGIINRGQSDRLRQIVRQVEGVASLRGDSEAWVYLGLSAEQREKVKAACDVYSKKRRDIVHHLGRQMIAGLSRDETLADREKELKRLSRDTRALDADLDSRLSDLLNSEQRAKWDSLQGRPLNIEWAKGGPPLLMYY